jgi:Nuclease-related domain
MYQPHPDHDPDEPVAGDLQFRNTGDPEDDPEELGTPVYEGTGLSVRALTAEELDRFLQARHGQPARPLGRDGSTATDAPPSSTGASLWGSPDPIGLAALGWQPPALAGPRLAPRGGYGSPGRSALQAYRRERAAELGGWARTAGWRAAAVVAAGMTTSLLVQAAGLGQFALAVGLVTGMVVGWRLRFRVSQAARAWRDGARGERATARLLRRLHRRSHAVFHDIGIPGTPANADHLVIGPAGVLLVDSKRYTGLVSQTADGRVRHNLYPMDQQLRALRLEAEAISQALGVRARPLMCVHGAQVAYGGLQADMVQIVPAGRLCSMLRHSGQQLQEPDVAALVAHALSVLRPAG